MLRLSKNEAGGAGPMKHGRDLMPLVTRRALAPLFGAAALFALLGSAASAEPFRLIVNDQEVPLVPNSVMHLADTLGYYEREGLDVELVPVEQTPSIVAALRAGEGEMANVSVDALLQLVGRDQMKLKAVISPNKAIPYIIAGRQEIGSLADLKGRSFGVGRIGSLDYSLSSGVLQKGGVDPQEVSFVNLGQPNVRAQALSAGQIDATTMSIGAWMNMENHEGLKIVVPQDEYFAAAPVVNKVNAVTEEVLASRRDDIQKFVNAIIKASRDFAKDPNLWVEAMAKARPDVDRKTLEELAKAYRGAWSVNGGLNKDELAFTTEWTYANQEDLQGVRRVELSEWVDTSFIDKALAELGEDPSGDKVSR